MKFVIPGGSGQVGDILARAWHSAGHEVVVLSRRPPTGTPGMRPWRMVLWDAQHAGKWAEELEGADAVINLAGRSVNCRYTPEHRREIMDSRTQSTHAVGAAIAAASRPPAVWLQMSTATIYAHRYDAPNDEFTGLIGGAEAGVPDTWRFSIDVARAWEAATSVETPRTRKVLMRAAMVMSPDRDGIFDTLLGLVRVGLGGTSGSGKQYMSWIHDRDMIRAVDWLIAHDGLSGPVNLASPQPLPNAAFMAALRDAWGSWCSRAAA